MAVGYRAERVQVSSLHSPKKKLTFFVVTAATRSKYCSVCLTCATVSMLNKSNFYQCYRKYDCSSVVQNMNRRPWNSGWQIVTTVSNGELMLKTNTRLQTPSFKIQLNLDKWKQSINSIVLSFREKIRWQIFKPVVDMLTTDKREQMCFLFCVFSLLDKEVGLYWTCSNDSQIWYGHLGNWLHIFLCFMSYPVRQRTGISGWYNIW